MAINGLGLNIPLSGMTANQLRQDVTANNVANATTDGFQASAVQTADTVDINGAGQGTTVSATYAPSRPGSVAENPTMATGMVELSNTDMLTETVNRIGASNAYGANIPALQTMDQAAQTLIDLKG